MSHTTDNSTPVATANEVVTAEVKVAQKPGNEEAECGCSDRETCGCTDGGNAERGEGEAARP